MPNEIKSLENGRISAKLETGEVFEGDPLEVTTKLAEAQVNTKRWGQGFKQELETLKATPVQQPPTTVQQPADANEAQLQQYLLDQHAKALGYQSGEAYKQSEIRRQQQMAQQNWKSVVADFNLKHPEFNPADDAAQKVIDYAFESYNLSEYGFKNFDEFASMDPQRATTILDHSVAAMYHRGELKPMSEEEQRHADGDRSAIEQQRNPTAPPMLRTNNPEMAAQQLNDPYSMKLDDLRKAAIAQELARK